MRHLFTILFLCMTAVGPLFADEAPQKPALPMDQTKEDFYNHPFMHSESPSQDHFMNEFLNMLVVLTFTLVAMVAIAWSLKRFLYRRLQQVNMGSGIRIEEQRSLSPRSTLYVVEIEGTRLLLGETATSVVRLAQISSHEDLNSANTYTPLENRPND